MYEHYFLSIPGRTLCFPMYDVETFWASWMSCGTAVMVNWRRGFEMFLDPFSQCPA